MISSIERLPVEIWFIILSQIDGNDVRKAFSNLNTFFTSLLNSPRLRICLNIKTGGCNVFKASRIPFCPETFEALHANLYGTSDLLLFLDSISSFPNLRSLSLHIRRQKNYLLLQSLLPQVPSLQYLAVSCAMFNFNKSVEPLFNRIFQLPQLRICKIRLSRNVFYSSDSELNLAISTSLRRFHLDASIPSASIHRLVQCMPSLRALNVHLYRHDMDGWSEFSLPQITKRACTIFMGRHICFENLAKAAPNLVYLHTIIEPYSHLPYNDLVRECNMNIAKTTIVYVQMTWKRNSNSDMFDIIPPITIQGREHDNENWVFEQTPRDYSILKKYSNIV
ncbi:hypothetical protein I4U23_003867 [Adineta vaga]|nr:hypothetical protein I4U23_003867 [Adineta vaga]